jgi:hypothetical protein
MFASDSFRSKQSMNKNIELDEWDLACERIVSSYRAKCGIDFSPSKLSLPNILTDSNVSVSTVKDAGGDRLNHRIWNDERITDAIGALSALKEGQDLSSWFVERLEHESLSQFWIISVEAAWRLYSFNMGYVSVHIQSALLEKKMTKKRRLQHNLYFEFFKLKAMIAAASSKTYLASLLNSLDVSEFSNIYAQMGALELKSCAKMKSVDMMGFLQKELFPVVIRDIPFAFIRKISDEAFDFELFMEDACRFWSSPINNGWDDWRKQNPLHQWNESFHRQTRNLKQPIDVSSDMNESLVTVYEAPWVMPSKGEQRSSTAPRQSVVAPTARMVRLEGRRQSYRPSPDANNASSGAICALIQDSDDGFAISRGVLDAMRDWHGEESAEGAVMLTNDGNDLGDILDDLLHTPTQPATRASSPVKANNPLSSPGSTRKRRANITPKSNKRIRNMRMHDQGIASIISEGLKTLGPNADSLKEAASCESKSQNKENSTNSSEAPGTIARIKYVPTDADEMNTLRAKRRLSRDSYDVNFI